MTLKLVIGNKNYSSWSMRPWLAIKAAGIPFTDQVIPFDFLNDNPAIRAISETGKVPLLIDGDFKVDRKSTRLNSSHRSLSRMPSSA